MDFSKVTSGRQNHQRTYRHGGEGTIMVERSKNPLGNMLGH